MTEHCPSCEDKQKMEEIGKSCSLCSTKIKPPEKILNVNREVDDSVAVNLEIDKQIEKQHKEAINGYDHQIEECLRDVASFSAKLLLMFEDYKKKGNTESLVKILNSMKNYSMLIGTDGLVLKTTIDSLLEKLQGAG